MKKRTMATIIAIRMAAPLMEPPMIAPLLVPLAPAAAVGELESVGAPAPNEDVILGQIVVLVVDEGDVVDEDEDVSEDEDVGEDEVEVEDIDDDEEDVGQDEDCDEDDTEDGDDSGDEYSETDEGSVVTEGVCDVGDAVSDPLGGGGSGLGSSVALEGWDPMEVGSGRTDGNAVSGTAVSSSTKLVMPSTDVSTVVPNDDAVPQPNWKYPPAKLFL